MDPEVEFSFCDTWSHKAPERPSDSSCLLLFALTEGETASVTGANTTLSLYSATVLIQRQTLPLFFQLRGSSGPYQQRWRWAVMP
jgi:hypothetical protein